MTVYFVRKNTDPFGPIKIGFTRKMEARLEQLNRAVDGGVFVFASCEGGAAREREFHQKLAAHRLEGEWFSPSDEVLSEIEALGSIAQQTDPLTRDRVLPDDEFSNDIRVETRFYLNELVKREWRGYGDSLEGARDRVLDRIGVHRAQGKLLFHKLHRVKSISGDVYRLLSLAYCDALYAEGRAEDRHMRIMEVTHAVNSQMRAEGSIAADAGYFAPWKRL
jgi:hypothetical protein